MPQPVTGRFTEAALVIGDDSNAPCRQVLPHGFNTMPVVIEPVQCQHDGLAAPLCIPACHWQTIAIVHHGMGFVQAWRCAGRWRRLNVGRGTALQQDRHRYHGQQHARQPALADRRLEGWSIEGQICDSIGIRRRKPTPKRCQNVV